MILNNKIIAVDFDGTLCKDRWPGIGKPNTELFAALILAKKELQTKVILWTCRRDDLLTEAVAFCKEYGLTFDAINENLPEVIERMHGDSRKIYADLYIDDRNAIDPSSSKRILNSIYDSPTPLTPDFSKWFDLLENGQSLCTNCPQHSFRKCYPRCQERNK